MQHIIRDSPTIKYSAQITNRYNCLIIKKTTRKTAKESKIQHLLWRY